MLFVLFVLPQILLLGGGLADKTSISMPTAARTHQSRERVFVVGLVTGEISGTVSGLVRASVDGNVNLRVISGRIADGAQPENPRLEEGSMKNKLPARILAALLALVLVLSLCPIALAAEAETVSIGSLHQLQAFAKRCGADTYSRD